jgi:tetratricopeptide (TPR) repeat protein
LFKLISQKLLGAFNHSSIQNAYFILPLKQFIFAIIVFSVCSGGIGQVGAQDYYSAGEAYLEQGQFRLAAAELVKATQQQPENIENWRLLGYSYRLLDILDSAVYAYRQVLVIAPDDYDAHLALGNLYSWIPKYDSSEFMYNFILANDSTDTAALQGLGRINAWQGKYVKAIDYYKRILRYEPENIRAYSGMAWAYAWDNNLAAANNYFKSALAKDSTFAEAYEGLARLNLWIDRPFTSEKYLNQALMLDPENHQYLNLKNELINYSSWRMDNIFAFWQEDDWGRVTKNYQVEEVLSKRISDRWYWTGNLAGFWSTRTSTSIKRRSAAVTGRYQYSDKLLVAGSIGYETINEEIDRGSLRIEVTSIKPIRVISIEARKGMFEPWSKTSSESYFGDISSYPVSGFTLSAGGGSWNISDGNQRVIGTINVKRRLLNKPAINIGYRYRYWDHEFRSPDYYSPQDVGQHELGADYRFNLKSWIAMEGDGYYSINSEEVKALSGSLSIECTMGKKVVGIFSFSGYDNNYDYSMLNSTIRLRIRL